MTSPQQSTHSSVLHRRPSYAVNSPSILCHRCYHLGGRAQDGSDSAEPDPTVALNEILYDIQMAGRRPGTGASLLSFGPTEPPSTPPPGVAEEKIGPEETILVTLGVLDGEADWTGWRARMRVDLHSEFYSVTFILDRAKLTTKLDQSPEKPPAAADAAPRFVHEWYTTRWRAFFDLLRAKGARRDFPLEQKFFECRGLVLDTAPRQSARAITPIIDQRAFTPERQAAKLDIEQWIDTNSDLMSEVLRLDRSQPEDQDANCILCSVMSGRGVYASSMGRSAAELRAARKAIVSARPERYLLLHYGLPRFMVGRLLRRFHVLDELRCASIFDFNKLLDVSETIRELGDKIDRKLGNSGSRQLAAEDLKLIQRDLNDLTVQEKTGGLLYRINRSRFYARSFRHGMEDLRFVRIQGWEPYDSFMRRTLFPMLDHIDSIGVRFEALAARIERLTEVGLQSKIAYIQEIGEYIGWTAAAYYAGQIFGKFIHGLQHHCEPGRALQWSDFCNSIGQLDHEVAGLMISCPLALYLYRKFKRKREQNP